ncbi:trigger factor [Candidatus Dependentiae bacterium]|nr:trigger factor [Candidatus Dependentiae bacterium]
MEVKETRKENSVISLYFEYQFDELKEEFKSAFRSMSREIAFPGFRKGKMPENLLRQRAMPYIISNFKEEYSKKILREYIEEKKYKLYSFPAVTKIEFDENQPFIMEVEFEVYPEFKLKPEDYSGLTIDKIEYEVTDTDVDNEIKNNIKRGRFTLFSDKEGKIDINDTVYVNLSGKDKEGNEISSLNIKDYPINIRKKVEVKDGANLLVLDEINNRLIGSTKENKIEFEYLFDNTVESEALSGKTAVITIEINKIQEETYPEINDELAAKMKYDSAEQMRNQIKENLISEKKQNEESKAINGFIKQIADRVKIDIPLTMVDNVNLHQRDSMEKSFEMYNMKKDSFYSILKTTPEEWLINNRENAAYSVKEHLIKNGLIELEKIEVTEEEVNAELEKIAAEHKTDKTKVKRDLIKSERWESFKDSLNDQKLEKHIISKFQK